MRRIPTFLQIWVMSKVLKKIGRTKQRPCKGKVARKFLSKYPTTELQHLFGGPVKVIGCLFGVTTYYRLTAAFPVALVMISHVV